MRIPRLMLPKLRLSKPIFAFLIIVVNATNSYIVPIYVHTQNIVIFTAVMLNGLIILLTTYEAVAPPLAKA